MTIKECVICCENIHCFDNVVVVGNTVFHEECVQLCPTEVSVFAGAEFIGVTQEFGCVAYNVLNEGEYEEELD